MIQDLFDKNVFIYAMGGMCLLGLLIKFLIAIVYKKLIKASENMGTTGNKLMKMLKLKFEACYKLKIGVNNVDVFVDKYVYKYKFGGILLYTWENLGGQILIICMLTGTVSAGLGLYNECGRNEILSTFFTGILASSLLIMFESFLNLPAKRSVLKANISDYLDNFLKVRLEREYFNPDLLEEYRNEYFDILATVSNKEGKKDRRELKRERKEEKEKKKAAQKKEKELTLSERQKEELKKESRKAALIKTDEKDSKLEKIAENKKETERRENKKLGRVEETAVKNNFDNNVVGTKNSAVNEQTSTKSEQEMQELIGSLIKSMLEKENDNLDYSESNVDGNRTYHKPSLEDITTDMLIKEFEKRKKLLQSEKDGQATTFFNNQKLNTVDNFAVTKEVTSNHVVDIKDAKKDEKLDNQNVNKLEDSMASKELKKVKKPYTFNENEEKIIEDILKEFLA